MQPFVAELAPFAPLPLLPLMLNPLDVKLLPSALNDDDDDDDDERYELRMESTDTCNNRPRE